MKRSNRSQVSEDLSIDEGTTPRGLITKMMESHPIEATVKSSRTRAAAKPSPQRPREAKQKSVVSEASLSASLDEGTTPRGLISKVLQSHTVEATVKTSRTKAAINPDASLQDISESPGSSSTGPRKRPLEQEADSSLNRSKRSRRSDVLRKTATMRHFIQKEQGSPSSRPTPRTMIQGFIAQATEETPVVRRSPRITKGDSFAVPKDVPEKTNISIKEDSFLDALQIRRSQRAVSGLSKRNVRPVQPKDIAFDAKGLNTPDSTHSASRSHSASGSLTTVTSIEQTHSTKGSSKFTPYTTVTPKTTPSTRGTPKTSPSKSSIRGTPKTSPSKGIPGSSKTTPSTKSPKKIQKTPLTSTKSPTKRQSKTTPSKKTPQSKSKRTPSKTRLARVSSSISPSPRKLKTPGSKIRPFSFYNKSSTSQLPDISAHYSDDHESITRYSTGDHADVSQSNTSSNAHTADGAQGGALSPEFETGAIIITDKKKRHSIIGSIHYYSGKGGGDAAQVNDEETDDKDETAKRSLTPPQTTGSNLRMEFEASPSPESSKFDQTIDSIIDSLNEPQTQGATDVDTNGSVRNKLSSERSQPAMIASRSQIEPRDKTEVPDSSFSGVQDPHDTEANTTEKDVSSEYVEVGPSDVTTGSNLPIAHVQDNTFSISKSSNSLITSFFKMRTPILPPKRRSVSPPVTTLYSQMQSQPQISTPASAQATQSVQQDRPKPSPKKKTVKAPPTVPRIPRSLTKRIFSNFAKFPVNKEMLDVVENIGDEFWTNVVSDVETYAAHAGRVTVHNEDVELLMRRQGFITEKQSLHTLIEKYLPLEARKLLIPCATSGSKVFPPIK